MSHSTSVSLKVPKESGRLLPGLVGPAACDVSSHPRAAHTAALPPSPREVQQKHQIQNGGRGDSEINGTSRWEDVGFGPVELLVVAEDQIFRSHSIVARGKDRQLQAACSGAAPLAVYLGLRVAADAVGPALTHMVEVVFLEEFLQRPERENLTQQLFAFGLGSNRRGLKPHSPASDGRNQQNVRLGIKLTDERIPAVGDVYGKIALPHLGLELDFNFVQPLRTNGFGFPFG